MKSMTGIGEAAAQVASHRVTVTVRSVNHRHLDVAVRLRAPWRSLEPEVRAAVSAAVRRGRVEVGVEIETTGAAGGAALDLCDQTADALQQAVRRWRRRGIVASELSAGELLSAVRGARTEPAAPLEPSQDAEARALAVEVCRRAVAALVVEREREGRALERALRGQLADLRGHVDALAARREEVIDRFRGDLQRRVAAALDRRDAAPAAASAALDPVRVVQEVALLVERSDTAEELERLGGHLDGFESAMAEPGAVGRRLDFLTQEIFRELNTVGSKCRDLDMQRTVVEGKVLCEQLREQVQNVE